MATPRHTSLLRQVAADLYADGEKRKAFRKARSDVYVALLEAKKILESIPSFAALDEQADLFAAEIQGQVATALTLHEMFETRTPVMWPEATERKL